MYVGFIKSDEPPEANTEEGQQIIDVEPGEIRHLRPGESFEAWNPNRPNSQLDPFIRLMLREVGVGSGPSYEAVSGDYSQSNYSSSRLASLVERDHWRVLQQWFIRSFREPLHRLWLTQAATFGALPAEHMDLLQADPTRYFAARWKPRGWSWVDPTKEVTAYKEAERAGYCTKSDIIAATAGGLDLEDVMKARRQELDLIEGLGLEFDTGPMEEPEEPVTSAPDQETETEPEPEDTTSEDAADDGGRQRAILRTVA
jgi:lambda family phage portal protein